MARPHALASAGAAALLAILLLPSASADPPADAFCVITIEASHDFTLLRYTIDEETNLTEREALWPSVDVDGDDRIVPEEKARFARVTMRLHPNATGMDVPAPSMFPNNARGVAASTPHYAATWREVGHTFHQRNYTTPQVVTKPVDLETQGIREYRFRHDEPVDRAVLVRGGPPQAPTTTTTTHVVIEYVVVRAPPGWIVARVAGWGYDGEFVLDPRTAVVDVPAFDTKRPYAIVFEREAPSDATTTTVPDTPTTSTSGPPASGTPTSAPAPAGGLGLLVALLVGVVASRRRLPS